uniref:Uncharacterized protein n=1 Tax=Polysiphonia infestans TaxID=2006978 RepID=A0A1Z1MEU5_9FLOR|nr:hypothetical protein [Polysiphonia infestans]ARW64429.1 hypothetical protein [Polysiphonia infestans]
MDFLLIACYLFTYSFLLSIWTIFYYFIIYLCLNISICGSLMFLCFYTILLYNIL